MDEYKEWIGKEFIKKDIITPRLVDHLKKTLGQDNFDNDQDIPGGIFFCLCPDVSSVYEIGDDGNTKLGILLPKLPYKIRMWAGGKIDILNKFTLGSEIEKKTKISNIEFKKGKSGNLCFVKLENNYLSKNKLIVHEKQTAVYREKISRNIIPQKNQEKIEIIDTINIYGSTTLLFRYSALTFNSHKIHYDESYTKNIEGHSSLLVHAPLQATYLLNLAKKNKIQFSSFEYKAVSPLFHNNEFSIQIGKNKDNEMIGKVVNHNNIITMEAFFK